MSESLGELAMKFRLSWSERDRLEITRAYEQEVAKLVESGTWDVIPALEDQLPGEYMPKGYYDYWRSKGKQVDVKGKASFVVREDQRRKDIFIDGELFEYEVDKESVSAARRLGPEYYLAAQRDIQKHFLDSLSDFLGRPVKGEDVKEAIRTGWI